MDAARRSKLWWITASTLAVTATWALIVTSQQGDDQQGPATVRAENTPEEARLEQYKAEERSTNATVSLVEQFVETKGGGGMELDNPWPDQFERGRLVAYFEIPWDDQEQDWHLSKQLAAALPELKGSSIHADHMLRKVLKADRALSVIHVVSGPPRSGAEKPEPSDDRNRSYETISIAVYVDGKEQLSESAPVKSRLPASVR